LIRADLHVHTIYSGDSRTTLEQAIARCQQVGINCLAVTDHNRIAGALEMQRIAPFKVIVGEEIHTRNGEVIGFFMQEEIPKGLPVDETVRRIKEQGGLVGVPHPFDNLRQSALQRSSLEQILPQIDIIEAFNARVMLRRHNDMAAAFAAERGLPASAGSDAHTVGEIGKAYVEMPEFGNQQEFLAALSQGKVIGRVSPPWVHIWSSWSRIRMLRWVRSIR
jgi:predicted metal-dependent phosphoesterase TrpH